MIFSKGSRKSWQPQSDCLLVPQRMVQNSVREDVRSGHDDLDPGGPAAHYDVCLRQHLSGAVADVLSQGVHESRDVSPHHPPWPNSSNYLVEK